LVPLEDRFSLPINHNKKLAVHEIIKDVEKNIKSFHIENQIRIRNTIIPQFHKLLYLKTPKNAAAKKLISMTTQKIFAKKIGILSLHVQIRVTLR